MLTASPSLPPSCSNLFSRAVDRIRELGEPRLGRPRTSDEERETEYERGKVAGLVGYRLRGVESKSFIVGHARGSLDARGE